MKTNHPEIFPSRGLLKNFKCCILKSKPNLRLLVSPIITSVSTHSADSQLVPIIVYWGTYKKGEG